MAKYPNKGLVNAFQRLEKRLHREEVQRIEEARAKKRDEVLQKLEEEYRRKKIIERSALAMTMVFSVVIVIVVWFTKPDLFKPSKQTKEAQGKGAKIDCTLEENQALSACRRKKMKVRSESDWGSMSLDFKGKPSPFTLYRPDQGK